MNSSLNHKASTLRVLILSVVLTVITTAFMPLVSQNYFAVKYIKVDPAHESEYLQLELEVWKKIHSARIEAGLLTGWYLMRVVSPAGSSTPYNYLTVEVYEDAFKLAGNFEGYGVNYAEILDTEEISQALKTEEVRNMIYEEVWRTVDQIIDIDQEPMYRYQVFNAMQLRPGTEESEYQRMEQEYWKPMHQRRISLGQMKGWGLYTMVIPGGTERDYQWATVDFYDNFINYLQPTDAILEAVHGEKNAAQYLEETLSKRDLLRAEIRELVAYVNQNNVN